MFEVDADGVSVVIATSTEGHEDCILAAAEECPADAIIVDEA